MTKQEILEKFDISEEGFDYLERVKRAMNREGFTWDLPWDETEWNTANSLKITF